MIPLAVFDSSEKCFEFYLRMTTVLKEGKFNLRK